MNFLRDSFTAASHKIFRHMLRSGVSSNRGFATAAGNLESEQVAEKMNRRAEFGTYKTSINDSSKAEELSRPGLMRQVKWVSPNKTTYECLIKAFCKLDMFDDAYRVLNEMVVGGFDPSYDTLEDVIHGFLRIGNLRKAFEVNCEHRGYLRENTRIVQDLSDEVTLTSLMNACLDEGKWGNAETLLRNRKLFPSLPYTNLLSVIINGLDKKARTTEVKKFLLGVNYNICPGKSCSDRPILEYHSTIVENISYDEFKSVVELVEGICSKGLENVFDTMLKLNYKPEGIDDGIVYNLFIFAHCRHSNVDEAYIMYKEMVHYGFACHMFTVFALIKALNRENMVNELLWVIQNVLRSCNLNDSEIVKFLNEFNPKKPDSEALFDVLVEKAKDGLFLKCSYAPPSV